MAVFLGCFLVPKAIGSSCGRSGCPTGIVLVAFFGQSQKVLIFAAYFELPARYTNRV
jgi:hypothetical protein